MNITLRPIIAHRVLAGKFRDVLPPSGDGKRDAQPTTERSDQEPDGSRRRIAAVHIQNLDHAPVGEDAINLFPEGGPPSHVIDPVAHATELFTGTQLALDKLRENEVYFDTPTQDAVGGKYIDCRWENRWVWDGTTWIIKMPLGCTRVQVAGVA